MASPSEKYLRIFREIIDAPDVNAAVLIARAAYELENITYHMPRVVGAAVGAPFVRTTYDTAWVSHYVLNNLATIDPVLRIGMERDEPFIWSECISPSEFKGIAAHALKFNIGLAGYTVPICDKKNRRAILSINSHAAPEPWAAYVDEIKDDMLALAFDIHQKAITEACSKSKEFDIENFAPREIQCLAWAAKGKTYLETAIILGLSEHTVRTYLKSVRMKLGSVTIAQAVSTAERSGLL